VTRKVKVKRRAYVRRDGVKVGGSTYLRKAKDEGSRPTFILGWRSNLPVAKRRGIVLATHGGDKLSAARDLQRLANATSDRRAKVEARRDALFFFKEYGRGR
jgi:hypothetical protein